MSVSANSEAWSLTHILYTVRQVATGTVKSQILGGEMACNEGDTRCRDPSYQKPPNG